MMPLSPNQLTFLQRQRVAHLATASADARPHVIPCCFALDRNFIVSIVDQKPKRVSPRQLRRVLNITNNPRAAVVVDEYSEDWTRLGYLLIEGPAKLIDSGPDFQRGLVLLRDHYPQYRSMDLGAGPLLRIAIERVTAWGTAL